MESPNYNDLIQSDLMVDSSDLAVVSAKSEFKLELLSNFLVCKSIAKNSNGQFLIKSYWISRFLQFIILYILPPNTFLRNGYDLQIRA